MWNLPGKVLNDEATGCVFMRSCGQLVNALTYNDFPLKYLLPCFQDIIVSLLFLLFLLTSSQCPVTASLYQTLLTLTYPVFSL